MANCVTRGARRGGRRAVFCDWLPCSCAQRPPTVAADLFEITRLPGAVEGPSGPDRRRKTNQVLAGIGLDPLALPCRIHLPFLAGGRAGTEGEIGGSSNLPIAARGGGLPACRGGVSAGFPRRRSLPGVLSERPAPSRRPT